MLREVNINNVMLYTFIADYGNHVFIDQFQADNLMAALALWKSRIIRDDESGINRIDEFENEEPIAVKGTKNCWCHVCWSQHDKLIILHIVLTASDSLREAARVKPDKKRQRITKSPRRRCQK